MTVYCYAIILCYMFTFRLVLKSPSLRFIIESINQSFNLWSTGTSTVTRTIQLFHCIAILLYIKWSGHNHFNPWLDKNLC
jgi:hypothetical protein